MAEKKAAPDKAAEVSLKDEIIALAAKIKKSIDLDKKTGIATASDDLYKDNLPEDLTMVQVKAVTNYNTNFIAATGFAFGELAVEAMKSNKGLERATLDIDVGTKDSVSHIVERCKTYTNHLGGGEKTVKHGVLTTNYSVRAGKNGGQLKAARQLVAEMASKALAK